MPALLSSHGRDESSEQHVNALKCKICKDEVELHKWQVFLKYPDEAQYWTYLICMHPKTVINSALRGNIIDVQGYLGKALLFSSLKSCYWRQDSGLAALIHISVLILMGPLGLVMYQVFSKHCYRKDAMQYFPELLLAICD